MTLLDLIVLAVLVLCAVKGGGRGLWLTLACLFGTLVAMGGAWVLHPAIKAWLRGEPQLITGLQRLLLGSFPERISPEGAQEALLRLADVLNQSMLPDVIKGMLLAPGSSSAPIAATLNETALSFISFTALLLIITLLIQIGALLLDRAFKFPGLGLLNRVGGLLLGAAEGLCLIWIALAVLTPWIAFRPEGMVAEMLSTSRYAGYLYQHNFLLHLIDFTLK